MGRYPAMMPEIKGRTHLTGCHEFVTDLDDP